eukprot:scaffold3770_cov99-Skeletonema_dohrnii-CCMP3373.AAC.4
MDGQSRHKNLTREKRNEKHYICTTSDTNYKTTDHPPRHRHPTPTPATGATYHSTEAEVKKIVGSPWAPTTQ